MKTFLVILVLALIVLAVVAALKARRTKQLNASRRSLTVQQAQADLASFRKAQEPFTVESGTPVTYSGGVAKPVTSKPSPKPKKSYHNSSDDGGASAYDYTPPTYGYVDYDSKPSYTDSSPSTYSSPSSSDSSSSSGSSGGSSYGSGSSDSGSSSSSGDSGGGY